MRTRLKAAALVTLAGALVALVAGDAGAQKVKCPNGANIGLQVSLVPIAGSVLFYDNIRQTAYTDGVDGVASMIFRCQTDPSYDAVLNLLVSRKRSIGFDFSESISSPGGLWPAWTASRFLTKPFVNVRNILWGRMYGVQGVDGSYTFATRMSIGYIQGPSDRSDYDLRFLPWISPPDGPAPILPNPFIDDSTVPVTVVDTPSTCTWTVTVDAPYVGVLYKATTEENYGYFTMPFKLELKAKTCPF